MIGYEYKVIPAPAKGLKARGIKGPEARFAHALEQRINELAAEGWEYLRADILPSEERQGLTSTETVYRSLLVFQRPVGHAAEDEGTTTEDLPAAQPDSDDAAKPGKDQDAEAEERIETDGARDHSGESEEKEPAS